MLTFQDIKLSQSSTPGFGHRLVLLSLFFVFISTNLLQADTVRAQNADKTWVSVSVDGVRLIDIFDLVEQQTRFQFLYALEVVQKIDEEFTYELDSVSVEVLLKDISERTGLWFWQNNSSIAVNSKPILPETSNGRLICPDECPSLTKKPEGEGDLKGTILEAGTNEPVYGATIALQGTSIGVATDEHGEFYMRKIHSGTHTFLIRYLGYKTKTLQIEIIQDQVVEVDILLEPDVVEGEDIVVYSQAEGQAEAIRKQTSSTSVINVVSESRIRELPDANAAESVGRLPGVSVIRDSGEGQRIAIRGLSPRHNSITLDGDRIPSSDENGRAVNLNMISPEMLSGIELYKSIRPDMDADAIGGSVNFKFAGVPDKRTLKMSLGGGYSNHVSKIGNYNVSFNGSDRMFKNKLGVLASIDVERNDRSSDSFNGGYEVLRDAREGEEFAPIGVSSINLRDKSETRDRYGAGVILDFRVGNGNIMFNNFASRLDRDISTRSRSYNVESFSQNHGIRNTESQTDILSSRLSGEHNTKLATVEWRVSRNTSKKSTPYDHSVDFEENGAFESALVDRSKGPSNIPPAAINDIEDTSFGGSNFEKTSNRELDHSGQLDISIPLRVGDQLSGKFKLGGKGVIKERKRTGREWAIRSGDDAYVYQNEDRNWIFTPSGRMSIENYLLPNYSNSDFLDDQYDMSVGIDKAQIRELWEIHEEDHIERLTINFDDQKVTERIYGAYTLAELNIGSRIILLPGVRYEYTNSEYIAKQGQVSGNYRNQGQISDTVATRKFGMLFPMVHARAKLTDWLDIRMARTETISRPNFTELLPREEVSANSRHVKRGTPGLDPAESTNYDLFLTAFGNKIGLLSIGAFYKEIDNLIYNRKAVVLDPQAIDLPPQTRGYDLYEPFNNPNETTVKGFEIEWQSNLMYLPKPFNGLVLNVNYTRIWSETQYPQFYLERTPQGIVGVDTYREGPMVNQPDYVVNLSIGYDYNNLSLRTSMVYQGATLTGIGARQETDSFTEEFLRWDAALKYKVAKGLSVFANLQNINNRPDLANQFTESFPTYQEYYGWSADMGIRYDFY